MQMMGGEKGAAFSGRVYGEYSTTILFQGKGKQFPQKCSLNLHTYNCKLRTCPRNILVQLFMVKKSNSTCLFLVIHSFLKGKKKKERKNLQGQTLSNPFLFRNSKNLGMLDYMNIAWSKVSGVGLHSVHGFQTHRLNQPWIKNVK